MAACSRRLASESRRTVEVPHVPVERKQGIYVKFFVGTHVGKLPFEGMSRLLEIYKRIWNGGVD